MERWREEAGRGGRATAGWGRHSRRLRTRGSSCCCSRKAPSGRPGNARVAAACAGGRRRPARRDADGGAKRRSRPRRSPDPRSRRQRACAPRLPGSRSGGGNRSAPALLIFGPRRATASGPILLTDGLARPHDSRRPPRARGARSRAGDRASRRPDAAQDATGTMALMQFELLRRRARPGRDGRRLRRPQHPPDRLQEPRRPPLPAGDVPHATASGFSRPGNGICHYVHCRALREPGADARRAPTRTRPPVGLAAA